jgi:hypothetical protein
MFREPILPAIKLGTTRPYPDAAVAATTRCTLNFPVVAVSTILQDLRFLIEALWPAVDEIVAYAPYSSAVTAEETRPGSAASRVWSPSMASPSIGRT